MKVRELLNLIKTYYEVVDKEGNLLFTKDSRLFEYEDCYVYQIRQVLGFDGTPCIEVRILR